MTSPRVIEANASGHWTETLDVKPAPPIRIPASQAIVDDLGLACQLRDPLISPSRANLVPADRLLPAVGEEFIRSAEMFVSADGGSLRWFDGAQAHETGWYPSWKRGRLQHWEGLTQKHTLLKAECDWNVLWAQSEARRFRFMLEGRWREYTCDVEIQLADGTTQIIENKADERSLEDAEYRLTLAGVSEICRRVGFQFHIIMGDEVFANRHHRRNVELFASRGFATVTPRHIRKLEAFAVERGPITTYGQLSELLEPDFVPAGKAVVQALVVRRRVQIDLTDHVHDHTPVTLH
jgi:hypothetical protein